MPDNCARYITMFRFRQFELDDSRCGMKLGTDSVALGAWTEIPSDARTALDIGAGSGVLALMLAQRAPQLHVTALEYDGGACADCRRNFRASPWADRLTVIPGDFCFHKPAAPVDLIISNPPYFIGGMEAPTEERALARHQGTLSYISLIGYAIRWLSTDGSLSMILPCEQYDDALFRAEMGHLKLRRLTQLLPSEGRAPIRVMMQLSRHDGHCESNVMAIRNGGARTQEFAAMTHDFYL